LGSPILALCNFRRGGIGAKEHDSTEVLEPVLAEGFSCHSFHHGICVTTLDLFVESVAEILEQGWWNAIAR
jgi:hypothetical protein